MTISRMPFLLRATVPAGFDPTTPAPQALRWLDDRVALRLPHLMPRLARIRPRTARYVTADEGSATSNAAQPRPAIFQSELRFFGFLLVGLLLAAYLGARQLGAF